VAQSMLGKMYEGGRGVKQDYAKAVSLYRKAAEQGSARGQEYLGFLYARGRGVPQDFVLGYFWLNLAAAQGNEKAATVREAVAQIMTPAQIAEAQRLAREWMAKFEARKKK